MSFFRAFLLALGVASSVSASIGPVATLNIVNSDIAPDGFLRSTVLAGGTFPGPLIFGDKVSTTNFLGCRDY